MKIYLDNCCYNRPYDDQSQKRIYLESEAKLIIQRAVRLGKLDLVWSYLLDYENNMNPSQERKSQINTWVNYAIMNVDENQEIVKMANHLNQFGFKKIDSLHIACAENALCRFFITTDDQIVKRSALISEYSVLIINPKDFVQVVLSS